MINMHRFFTMHMLGPVLAVLHVLTHLIFIIVLEHLLCVGGYYYYYYLTGKEMGTQRVTQQGWVTSQPYSRAKL